MAEGYLDCSSFNHRYSSSRYPAIWHIHPGMIVDSIYYSNYRDSNRDATVHWTVSLTLRKIDSGSFNGSTGYPIIFSAGGVSQTQTVVTSPKSYTFSVSFNTSWASSDNETISLGLVCHGNSSLSGCDYGCTDPNVSYSCSVPTYVSSTPATNVTRGTIYSTNNTSSNGYSRSISDKPDLEVWFDWWGQSDGVNNPISYYNIDINTSNSSSGASSTDLTKHYTQNTHVSLMTLCKNYGIKVGGTLYCWVNTYVAGETNAWLGRVYLGSITMIKDGIILYKDASGNKKECTMGYNKDTSGNKRKARYILIKDANGTKRSIDVYTTLYE